MKVDLDNVYITLTNAANSKQNFLLFLGDMECMDAFELVRDEWCDSDVAEFWDWYSGDLDRLEQQVYLWDCERLEIV